jgi:Cd2+/Zn2+-exporting ATPase
VQSNGLPSSEIAVGNVVIVRPGEKVPLDGTIVAGHSDVNEAPMTGESLPVDKAPGDEVYAGTINGRGSLELEVTRIGPIHGWRASFTWSKTRNRDARPVQSFVDRFARIYTPAVIVLAVLVALVPPLVGGADAATWFYRSLVLLVISCPCALVISTPVSFVSALSAAARNGVLIKGGAHLERLATVHAVAFDKTGTLTRGEPSVTDVIPVGSASSRDVLRFAAAVEKRSEHPIARAIAAHASLEGIDVPGATNFMSIPAGVWKRSSA